MCEVLSHKNWGASSTQMNQIAKDTYDYDHYPTVSKLLWEGLEGRPAAWRVVFKALTLLEHLIKNGSERMVEDARNKDHKLRSLYNFNYFEGQQDRGLGVREKSKQIVEMLQDNERIREEREKAKTLRDKFGGVGSNGSGSGGGGGGGGGYGRDSYSGGGGGYGRDSRDSNANDRYGGSIGGGSSGGGSGYGNGGLDNASSSARGRYSDNDTQKSAPKMADVVIKAKKAPAPAPAPAPAVDLFSFDDAPAPAPAPVANEFDAFGGSSGGGFDAFQLAPAPAPAPAAAPPPPPANNGGGFDAFGGGGNNFASFPQQGGMQQVPQQQQQQVPQQQQQVPQQQQQQQFGGFAPQQVPQQQFQQQPVFAAAPAQQGGDEDFGDFAGSAPAKQVRASAPRETVSAKRFSCMWPFSRRLFCCSHTHRISAWARSCRSTVCRRTTPARRQRRRRLRAAATRPPPSTPVSRGWMGLGARRRIWA